MGDRLSDTDPQPMPTPGQVSVTRAVMADLEERERQGIIKYGTTLQTFNGRDALVDAYQESIDQVQYLKQAIMERDTLAERLAALEASYNQLLPCYEDARTTAARLLIEQGEYERGVRNANERAEFAKARAEAAEWACRVSLQEWEDERAALMHEADCNCRVCTVIIPQLQTVLKGAGGQGVR